MDFLKQWTICICLTLVVAVILSLLSPSSSMGRFYKMLISIFVFLSFIYPFADFDFSSLDFDLSTSEVEYENSLNDSSQIMIKNSILNILKSNNVIGAVVDIDSSLIDNEIYINQILVTIPDEYDTQIVKNIIFDNLSLNAEVVHIGQ